jgi:hypothetical protein
MGLRPTQGDEKPGPATTLLGSVALPFVISTEAQRSGGISVLMLRLGNVFRQSAAQWRDLRFSLVLTRTLKPIVFLCPYGPTESRALIQNVSFRSPLVSCL